MFIFACSAKPKSLPVLQDIGIPEENFDNHFTLIAPDGLNKFEINKMEVSIAVTVVGEYPISFEGDFGARIFRLDNDKWVEIPNLEKYPNVNTIVETANGDPIKTVLTGVDPVIYYPDHPVKVRIVLIGSIVKDGQVTNELAASYIDVDLKP